MSVNITYLKCGVIEDIIILYENGPTTTESTYVETSPISNPPVASESGGTTCQSESPVSPTRLYLTFKHYKLYNYFMFAISFNVSCSQESIIMIL